MITAEFIADDNQIHEINLQRDLDTLGEQLDRRGIDVAKLTARVSDFSVALPSWGVGTGGTRFARFPGPGEPQSIFDKLDDCGVIQQLGRATSKVSPHFPWDREDPTSVRDHARQLGLSFDAVNSNTFQDHLDDKHSYKFGSLSHTDKAVRDQAISHNIAAIEYGETIGSQALIVWVGDGSNFPGQSHFRHQFDRYLDSIAQIYSFMPKDWVLLTEHKMFEPAFYSTVVQDWGTNLMIAQATGDRAMCLVDLGHHAPNTNIEMIVARLLSVGKLGGFHFNDSKYGDDDLDTAIIDPYRLFLVFNELVDIEQAEKPAFAHMLDQSHNVTDPIESLIMSASEVRRAYALALLVDREALSEAQENNDAIQATQILKQAFRTDIEPVLADIRRAQGGAIDPISTYRKSSYRSEVAKIRPTSKGGSGGIV